jgi:methionyl-tRNA formyltransferase
LPKETFTIPPLGTLNVHASILPKYRGAAPINWAILNGETKTGVTTMLINEKVDTGNVLLQQEVLIHSKMTAGELHDELAEIGADLLEKTLEGLLSGNLKPIVQKDEEATKAPKLRKETCHLDFTRNSKEVYNKIRGLSPYPGAFFYHNQKQIKVYQSEQSEYVLHNSDPGKVVNKTTDRFTVKCGEGTIDILVVQLEGKKRLPVKEFFNGYKINLGDLLA